MSLFSKSPAPLLLLLLLGLMLVGCGDNGDDADDPLTPSDEITWDDDVSTVLAVNCASCHGGSSPQSGFSVESFASVMNHTTAAGNDVVDPGFPDNSEIVLRIEGNGFSRMPPGGSLSSDNIQLIRDWITDGALENSSN